MPPCQTIFYHMYKTYVSPINARGHWRTVGSYSSPCPNQAGVHVRVEYLVDRTVERDLCPTCADEWQAASEGERLGGVQPDQERAGQPRTSGDRDGRQVGPAYPGFGERPPDGRHDGEEVLARGDFRHDAAEAGVDLHLRGDDVGERPAPAGDDRRRRLVAGALDPEDEGRVLRLHGLAGHPIRFSA